jgi:hypothetical protein
VGYKLELVLIPVSDADRAGFRLEVDGPAGEGARIVRVTPPGSACPVGFGTGLGLVAGHELTAAPGSQQALHLVVDDIAVARDQLIARGVQVGEIRYTAGGSPASTPVGAATYRSPSSLTPTATCGCRKKSDPDRTRRKETRDGTTR